VARDLAIVLAAGAVATVLAELLGAVNLGTALTFGQIAVVATVLVLMLRGRGGGRDRGGGDGPG
jgi:hypothetical protein